MSTLLNNWFVKVKFDDGFQISRGKDLRDLQGERLKKIMKGDFVNAPYDGNYYRAEVVLVSDTQITLKKSEKVVIKSLQQISQEIKVETSLFFSCFFPH